MRPHHDVKAARPLHIARHIGHDLIATRNRLLQPPQCDLCIRVCVQTIGADAIVADIHLVVKGRRETVALPIGRHMPQIHHLAVEAGHHIAGAVEIGRMGAGGLFGIKAHHATVHAVVIFKESNNRHIRPQILKETKLPPTGMTKNDIGAKPVFLLKLLRRLHRAKARTRRRLPVLGKTKAILCRRMKRFVDQRMNARDFHIPALAQEHQLMSSLCRKPPHQFTILARHVLMHKKDLHPICFSDIRADRICL